LGASTGRRELCVKLSPSSLLNFETCPHQFYRLRVARDVEPDPPGAALQIGKRDHKSFEDRFGEPPVALPAHLAPWEPLCSKLLEGCHDIRTEYPLALTEDLEPCVYKHPQAWLRGYVDFLGFRGDKAVIIDWKTGKRRPKPLQLYVYTLAVFLHAPEVQEVMALFVWTKDQAHDEYTTDREDLHNLTTQVLEACAPIDRALREDTWEKRPSGLCHKWCPVTDCEHNGRA